MSEADAGNRRELLRRGAMALGAGALGAAALSGARAEAANRKPNILLLMCDQERYPQWTPDLPLPARDWIDSRGVSFERFHHSAVPCSPSRSTFWTGLYTPQTGIFGNFLQSYQYSMDPSIPTIADLLKEQGYKTAYFGKWHLSFGGLSLIDGEGPVDNAEGNYLGPYGFDYSAPTLSSEPYGYSDGYYNDPIWTRQAVDWLGRHGAEEPWFMVVSLLNPHDIAYYPRGFTVDLQRPDWEPKLPLNFEDDLETKPPIQKQYHGAIPLITGAIGANDTVAWTRLLNIYCDLIVNTDENLAAIVKALAKTGALDDTVIIRTADHGEIGGSHHLHGKGPTMYEEQVRMPLSISWPKRFDRNVRTPALSEAVDLVPTCLEIAGVKDPVSRYPWLRGKSLVPALDDPAGGHVKPATLCSCDENWSPQDLAGIGPPWKKHMRALLTDRFKIARYVAITGGGAASGEVVEHTDEQDLEVYDLREDPYELRNLAADPAYASLVADLHAWLTELEGRGFAKLDLPEYGIGLPAIIAKDPLGRPDIPGVNQLPNGALTSGLPGAYIQLPVQDPDIVGLAYNEGDDTPKQMRGREASRAEREAEARVRATMLCELSPSSPSPRIKTGRYR